LPRWIFGHLLKHSRMRFKNKFKYNTVAILLVGIGYGIYSQFFYTPENFDQKTRRLPNEIANVLKLSERVLKNPALKKEAIYALRKTLRDFSSNNDLISALNHFAQNALLSSSEQIQIKEVDDERGSSQDRVFRVMDIKADRLIAIIKIFKETSDNFLPEIYALRLLNETKFQHFCSPELHMLGRCCVQEERYLLLCESAAPGRSLLYTYKESDLQTLLNGLYACGKSLAELHVYARGQPQSLPKPLETKTRAYLAQAIENLNKYPQRGIDPEKVREMFETIVAKVKSQQTLSGIIHGDTKLINVFFDPKTGIAPWIDPPKLPDSIDAMGNSIGVPAKDFYSFIADIDYQQEKYVLNSQGEAALQRIRSMSEVEQLKASFISGYKEGKGILPSKEELEFFSFAADLYFIAMAEFDLYPKMTEPSRSSKIYRLNKTYDNLRARLGKAKGEKLKAKAKGWPSSLFWEKCLSLFITIFNKAQI